ncbi:hypothetical protein ACFSCW_07320 [Sphingomonas tabacisoli]|uniref:Uncharacterized protein n=1 Tax=Sphingomonas tabacisoli TaxID=2249466 RepID=A0ABW4I1U9_9SPHN
MRDRENEVGFLQRRAEEELEAAQAASHPDVVRAHYTLASLYLDRLAPNDVRDTVERLR